jgi:hypothetical protein
MNEQLPITPAVAKFLLSDSAPGRNPLKLILISLAVASVLPAIFTVILLVEGRRFNPEWLIVWILFWVIGGTFAFFAVSDSSHERRDLEGGVFIRWIGPFAVRRVRGAVQVVVDGRKLQTLFAALEPTESGTGTVDYLPTSGMLLQVRDGSGQLLWSRFPGS